MNIENITKEQLIKKLVEMHQKIIELERYKKECKNLEDLLIESEGKYSSMLETGSVGILIVNEKGVITSCNKAVLEFSGFTRDELIGKYFTKRVNLSTKEIPRYLEMFKAVLNGKEGRPFEITQKNRNGDVLFGEVYLGPLKNRDNRVSGFKIIIKDITQKKNAENRLNESIDKFNLLFKYSLSGAVIHNNGKIMEVNNAFLAMFGCGSSSPVGKNLLEFIAPEFREVMIDKIRTDYKDSYEIKGHR
jgi:PAS domain S-box-containing protein